MRLKRSVGLGIVFILIGMGFALYFFPKEENKSPESKSSHEKNIKTSNELVLEKLKRFNGTQKTPLSIQFLFPPTQAPYLKQAQQLDQLSKQLTSSEIDALLLFTASFPQDVGLNEKYYNAVGDLVLCTLETQETLPHLLPHYLVTIFYDSNRNAIWRDYCLQHLGAIYPRLSLKEQNILETLFLQSVKKGDEMAGTAAIALANNFKNGIHIQKTIPALFALTHNQKSDDSNRLTAMLILAEQNEKKILPLIKQVIPSRNYSVHFRMSAIASLGMLGNPNDIALLKKYTTESDLRLRTASKAAIKKIKQRTSHED